MRVRLRPSSTAPSRGDGWWWIRAIAGVGVGRTWLLDIEIAWYAIVLAARVFGPPGTSSGHRGEFFAMVAVAAVCALAATSRWWVPRWTASLALTVIGVEVLVLLLRAPGAIGALRGTMSLALIPILLAAAVRRCRPWVAATATALVALAATLDVRLLGYTLSVALAQETQGLASPPRAVVVLAAVVTVVVPVALGLLLRSTDTARRAAALAATRTAERLQVARELHDTVSNHVTGMIVTAQAAGLSGEPAPRTHDALRAIEGAGGRALDAMQRMVGALRSADPGGAAAPEDETSPTTADAAVRMAIGDDDTVRVLASERFDDPLERAVAVTVHRLVSESLTNARRHRPPGTPIDVELAAPHPGRLVVQVTNRYGRSLIRGGGFGLIGLRERVAAVGGEFEAGPVDGDRWRVRAELPRR